MSNTPVAAGSSVSRDLADLLKNPYEPLTPEQVEHLDEYMSFKNYDTKLTS